MAFYPNIKGIIVSLRENKLGTVVDVDINIPVFLEQMEKMKQSEDKMYLLGIPRKVIENDNSTHICLVAKEPYGGNWRRKGEFTQRSQSVIGHDINEDDEFKESVLKEFDDGEEKPVF